MHRILTYIIFEILFVFKCFFEYFLFSVGRQVLTKRVGADDDVADADVEDITSLYKNSEGTARHQKQGEGCFSSPFSNYFINIFYTIFSLGQWPAWVF